MKRLSAILVLGLVGCGPTVSEEAPREPAPGGHAEHGHGEHGHGDHATVRHGFEDAERWAAVFDDPARDGWQQPSEVVVAMAIEPGMTVADIGAGTGYFNPWLSRAVGDTGKVLAIDIEESLVAHMRERAVRDGTPNVEARLGAADNPGLGEAEAERLLLVDVYHHIDDRRAYFGRLLGSVPVGGRLIVVDFKPEETPHGPAAAHRIGPEKVVAELEVAGWRAIGRSELPEQYVLVFERPS